MLKVMTVVGTRPEVIKLSRIIPSFDKFFDHRLIHTNQNYDYELNKIFFDELKIRQPDVFLDTASTSASRTISNVISQIDEQIKKFKPEAFFILGDTNSCLSAISAKRNKIPIFHFEAGNRCFDFRVPEEINRKIVDHVSDINITYSQIAKTYLLNEGLPADQIICAGSPMKEILEHYEENINSSKILKKINLKHASFFLISMHREETVDNKEKLSEIFETLSELKEIYKKRIIISCHPRTKNRLEKFQIQADKDLEFFNPFSFLDYIQLQKNAFIVISDSGTITEESSILNFPAINLREEHERPEGFEEGAVIFTGISSKNIKNAINILSEQKKGDQRDINIVRDYDDINISKKIVRIVLSYTDFINRRIWKKY
tara:strand:+ start:681 stop:1805 length:1125 start_codon:yes stop_codon:yes gene_type:complete